MSATFTPNRLAKDNAACLLVDHQAGLISLVQDFSPGEFKNKVLAVAACAKYFKLPTILTTSKSKKQKCERKNILWTWSEDHRG